MHKKIEFGGEKSTGSRSGSEITVHRRDSRGWPAWWWLRRGGGSGEEERGGEAGLSLAGPGGGQRRAPLPRRGEGEGGAGDPVGSSGELVAGADGGRRRRRSDAREAAAVCGRGGGGGSGPRGPGTGSAGRRLWLAAACHVAGSDRRRRCVRPGRTMSGRREGIF